MSNNKTLSLPKSVPSNAPTAGRPSGSQQETQASVQNNLVTTPLVAVATPEQVAEFLKANGLMVVAAPAEGGTSIPAIVQDTTINNPVESHRPDLSRLPPPGERASAPVQLPARTWGQPRDLSSR